MEVIELATELQEADSVHDLLVFRVRSNKPVEWPTDVAEALFKLAVECVEPHHKERPRPSMAAVVNRLRDIQGIAAGKLDISDAATRARERICVACMESTICTRFRPCFHSSVCVDCASHVMESSRKCPICKASVKEMEIGVFPATYSRE